MKLKNKIIVLITATLLALAGINLILNSASTKNFGVILALAGILTNIVVLVIMLKNEKWLSEL
ncbi:hypothetical protein [Dyadobacter sp. 3J3]|uniref:hypothetical protein n=1 Tax=Dyadobacter sp. 3J3 TaxID=2606600 RepID=UPI00135C63A8|nr:hypothetical protein [Dyadobacter sp. 3J3]